MATEASQQQPPLSQVSELAAVKVQTAKAKPLQLRGADIKWIKYLQQPKPAFL